MGSSRTFCQQIFASSKIKPSIFNNNSGNNRFFNWRLDLEHNDPNFPGTLFKTNLLHIFDSNNIPPFLTSSLSCLFHALLILLEDPSFSFVQFFKKSSKFHHLPKLNIMFSEIKHQK